MAEQDSLSSFDFNKVTPPSKFLKFEADKPVTIRVLTRDPVVQQREYPQANGEVNLRTTFCFVVWNFTDEKAQILSASPTMSKIFQRFGKDEDFGANLQKCDIKISPEGEKLERIYDINVLRHSGNEKQLTNAMIKEAQAINLDKDVKDNKGRLSEWQPDHKSGYDKAKEVRDKLEDKDNLNEAGLEGEEINLDDIPF